MKQLERFTKSITTSRSPVNGKASIIMNAHTLTLTQWRSSAAL